MNALDILGKDASILQSIKLWLLDMDGTIYQEDQIFPDTLDFLRAIREQGGEYVFITNNSSRSVEDYVSKVRRMGIEADPQNFFTSAQATILYLKEHYPGKRVYCQGTKSLIRELSEGGIDITEAVDPVDIVLVGFDTEMTSQKLRNTCEILTLQDVIFLAVNPDLVCPVSFGYVPDCGSICGMIYNATGKKPIYIGKPEPTMVYIAMQKHGCSPEKTAIVGDRLYTDIAAGVNAGVSALCVLSGEATMEDIRQSSVKPSFVFRDIGEIRDILRGIEQ